MLVTGKDKNNAGMFAYEMHDAQNVLIERVGKFSSSAECDFAATMAHRQYHAAMMAGDKFHGIFTDNMTTDEILAELDA